jgi:diacylglycerol kinase (ATP)
MEKIFFIVNPKAKNGYSLKIWKKVESQLIKKNIPYAAFFSEYQGHAKELSEQAAAKMGDKGGVLVAVGGDGTLHEVINGAAHYANVKIGFIPGGSGNDFSRGFHIPRKPIDALDDLLKQTKRKPKMIDLGKIVSEAKKTIYFVNNMGVGFDAVISHEANQSRMKKFLNRFSLGSVVYAFLLIKKMFTYRCQQIEAVIDGCKHCFDDVWFVTVSNQPYYGGGMKIAPGASPVDGKLNITVVHGLPKWKLLFLFGTVFRGTHIHLKEVKILSGKTISLSSSQPLLVHADGEVIGYTPIQIEVHQAVLPTLTKEFQTAEEADEKEMMVRDCH